MNTIQILDDRHQTIADKLLNLGIVKSRQAANATQSYAMIWQHGEDLKSLLSRSQFYQHKARLKAIGIDIGQQFDVSRMCPTLTRGPEIHVQPLAVPSWYQMPVVAQSNILPFKAVA